MAGSIWGDIFRVSTFGESHGKAVGAIIDGCPAGLPLSEEDIQIFLDRRNIMIEYLTRLFHDRVTALYHLRDTSLQN